MNQNVRTVITLLVGMGIGAIGTNIIMKNKYEQLIQEELYSIREVRDRNKQEDIHFEKSEDEDETVVVEYEDIASVYNHTSEPTSGKPFVISLEEFTEEMPNFDKETILFYAEDETLTDNNDEIIEVDSTIGLDALERFGERSEDPDIVYVRNVRLSIDYEVILQNKSYQEHMGLE